MLELFYGCLPVNECKLQPCWTAAKVRICFSLEPWLCFLSDILVEQTTFAILFRCCKVYQPCSSAGFPGQCKVPDPSVGLGWDVLLTLLTVNLCIARLWCSAGTLWRGFWQGSALKAVAGQALFLGV